MPPTGDDARYLIVNADDFGLSAGVNRGIIRAHESGIVTSASLMVRQPAADDAVALARRHPRLAVGLHLDFGEWVYRDGAWATLYEVVPADDPAAAADEVDRQLAAFTELVGRDPTHIDSHQHAHRSEPLQSIVRRIAEERGIPLRHVTPRIRYCGDFYGQSGKGEPAPDAIGVPTLLGILSSLPPGITEFACHPGEDTNLKSVYAKERIDEVCALCDPQVLQTISQNGIQLISFADAGEMLRVNPT
jgi:predicted glycoside hydrolase/deacetylase ChbG (UPF0249 family)